MAIFWPVLNSKFLLGDLFMSTNGNYWKPRQSECFTCPSGQKVYIRRPGPEFVLRAPRGLRGLRAFITDTTPQVAGNEWELMSGMAEDEQEALVEYARDLICACVTSPKLFRHPTPQQLGPDDTEGDFWPLFGELMRRYIGGKVAVGDTEVEEEDLKSFRPESSVPGDSVDSVHVSSDAQLDARDSGLVQGAGN